MLPPLHRRHPAQYSDAARRREGVTRLVQQKGGGGCHQSAEQGKQRGELAEGEAPRPRAAVGEAVEAEAREHGACARPQSSREVAGRLQRAALMRRLDLRQLDEQPVCRHVREHRACHREHERDSHRAAQEGRLGVARLGGQCAPVSTARAAAAYCALHDIVAVGRQAPVGRRQRARGEAQEEGGRQRPADADVRLAPLPKNRAGVAERGHGKLKGPGEEDGCLQAGEHVTGRREVADEDRVGRAR
mmetsp:Transcript_44179/g.109835  ORF Transcript_44179/g.109835 Transcript_44179/m.109835 type:complete len:246 (-) Transcript_44179:201-938(-)